VSLLFFFQAEDGIRDRTVTGVQTCALPILHKALMKSISRCELTPESHRVTNIATRDIRAGFSRHDAITLHPETIRTRAFVFLFTVNGEMSARCWLRRNPDTTRYCHQAAIALHHID